VTAFYSCSYLVTREPRLALYSIQSSSQSNILHSVYYEWKGVTKYLWPLQGPPFQLGLVLLYTPVLSILQAALHWNRKNCSKSIKLGRRKELLSLWRQYRGNITVKIRFTARTSTTPSHPTPTDTPVSYAINRVSQNHLHPYKSRFAQVGSLSTFPPGAHLDFQIFHMCQPHPSLWFWCYDMEVRIAMLQREERKRNTDIFERFVRLRSYWTLYQLTVSSLRNSCWNSDA